MSWLPTTDQLDLAMLLTFWSRDMLLHEDLTPPRDQTKYSAITVGGAITIRFPEGAPLLAAEFQELQHMILEVQRAHRTGRLDPDKLPSIAKLRECTGALAVAGRQGAAKQHRVRVGASAAA